MKKVLIIVFFLLNVCALQLTSASDLKDFDHTDPEHDHYKVINIEKQQGYIVLRWNVNIQSESRGEKLVLERAGEDGVFIPLKTIEKSVTNEEGKMHDSLDKSPLKGMNLYRLKEILPGGTEVIHPVTSIWN